MSLPSSGRTVMPNKRNTKSQNAKRNKAAVQCDIDYISYEKKTGKWRIFLAFDSLEEAEAALKRLTVVGGK